MIALQFDEKENLRPTKQPQTHRKKDLRKSTKPANVAQEGRKITKKKPKSEAVANDSPVVHNQQKEELSTNGVDDDYSDDFEGDQDVVEELRPEATSHMADGDAEDLDSERGGEGEREGDEIYGGESDEYESDQSGSDEESIPEEIENGEEYEEYAEESDDYEEEEIEGGGHEDIYENDIDVMDDEGPNDEELLQKLHAKRGGGASRGKTKTKMEADEVSEGNCDDTDVMDSESVSQSLQGNTDLRRRKKPPKDDR